MATIGVDFGGTWIRAAVINSAGTAGKVFRIETRSHRDAGSIMKDLTDLIETTRSSGSDPIEAIGLAIPTTLNQENEMEPCPNLPTMPEFPIVRELANRFTEPVWIENDARCFVLGEWRFGKGRGCETVAGITLGTSVGLGVIAHGSLLIGKHRQAGEIWRSPARLDNHGGRDKNPRVHDLLRGQALEEMYTSRCGRQKSVQDIADAARDGDEASLGAFHDYGLMLGNALSWTANILDPDIIILGGSGAKDFELFAQAAAEVLHRPDVKLEKTELGELAAILGAAEGAASSGRNK